MQTIIIKTQSELDNLPTKFDEFTNIEIRSNEIIKISVKYENCKVYAYDSSTVYAYGSSTVYAWDTSSIHIFYSTVIIFAYFFSTVYIKTKNAKIQKLYDKSTAKFCVDYNESMILEKHETAQIVTQQPELSFETYLERGFVKADGIMQKLVSKKKINDIEVFEVENFGKENSFVIKKGDVFSHGKTIEDAKKDLKYKISSRDTSEFKGWTLDSDQLTDDLIRAYRVITGACEFGTKHFCEQQGQLKDKYSVNEIIKMTSGQFGNEQFKQFFGAM